MRRLARQGLNAGHGGGRRVAAILASYLLNFVSNMTYKLFSAAIMAASLFIAGCKDAPKPEAAKAAKTASTPVSIAAITSGATGFTMGSPMSARTVYVFFDTQCSHCGALWYASQPLKSQAKFVWIPVGILNAASTAQGAALLVASDPVAEMDKHEASLMAKGGGMTAGSPGDAQKETIKKNTELMTRFGFSSIPTIVGTHAQTGALVSREGALPTAELAALLGLQVPAR